MVSTTRPTSLGGFLLLIAVVVIVMLLLGCFMIYLSLGQPPEKQAMAIDARWAGIKLIGASALLGAVSMVGKRFMG